MAFPVNLMAINAECVHAAAVTYHGFHKLQRKVCLIEGNERMAQLMEA